MRLRRSPRRRSRRRSASASTSAARWSHSRPRHPELRFERTAGEQLALDETFDYVVLSDLLPYVHDLVALFERVAAHSHPATRVIVHSYSRLWRPAIRLAELLRLKPKKPIRNWIAPEVIRNLLELADLEVVTETRRMLLPKRVPFLNLALNGFVGSVWPFTHLCLTYWVVARPRAQAPSRSHRSPSSCPCRNERGNVAESIRRLPLRRGTELVFVEGGSTDGTREEIEEQIAAHPELDIKVVVQTGRGKGDAVRAGFAAAEQRRPRNSRRRPERPAGGPPEVHRACADGRGDLVNGTRLVYDIEPGAMRFFNMLGNKIFRWLFQAITGQLVTDTLCGTKVLAQGRLRADRRGTRRTSASSIRSATSISCWVRRDST